MDVRRIPSLLNRPFAAHLLVSALCLCGVLTAKAQSAQRLDAIALVVNGQALTQLDLQRRQAFFLASLRNSNQPSPDPATLQSLVVERAVMETILLQTATKQGLTPTASVVKQAIVDNAVQSGLDLTQYAQRVEQSGIRFEDYETSVKNDIAISSVRDRAMSSKVAVNEQEIERFLRDPQSGIGQEYVAQALFVDKPENASTALIEQRRTVAQALRSQALSVNTMPSFAELQQQSQNSDSKHKVDLGAQSLDKLPELYSAALANMTGGQVSQVLESSAGFYILRLNSKRSILPKVQQTLARHILMRVENAGDEEKTRISMKSLHDRLTLNPGQFAAFATEFSQDGSASKGGELGWALPGDMVPEFERVMDSLKAGEIALPFRTQFGWHVVQVLDRKTTDLPQERLRARARQVLRVRKQEQAMGEWLDQLKAQAYIEYKQGYKP